MSFPLGICDCCNKPATTAMHHDGGSERYCEKHFMESRSMLVRQVICVDCDKAPAYSSPDDLGGGQDLGDHPVGDAVATEDPELAPPAEGLLPRVVAAGKKVER